MPIEEAMKKAIKLLSKGQITIAECERCIENMIVEETMGIEDLDERLEAYRKLKRKEWYMLLKITRR